MINNRQGGRRRGRGGQRPQNIGGQPGNRQDNRQRGNAAQLLEKYKSMARDAQLAGDRVQTEYYLQFADHYFRVLGESRARFEEQRRQRGDDSDEDEGDEDMADDGETAASQSEPGYRQNEQQASDDRDEGQRYERQPRRDRPDRGDRPERVERSRRYARDDRDDEANPRNGAERPATGGEGIAFDVLPPAIGRDGTDDEIEAEAPKPRRRARRPRAAEDEGDVAPAA